MLEFAGHPLHPEFALTHGLRRLRVPLAALLVLTAPAAALADIYKWTDESGRTFLSNVPPGKSDQAKNVETVLKEPPPAGKVPPAAPPHVATPTEQALLDRIEALERKLQAQQYAPPPAPHGGYAPSPTYYPPTYYPSVYYGGAYYGGYHPSYVAGYYYPAYPAYRYPIYPVYRYTAYPRPYIGRPVHVAPRGGTFHGGGAVHRGGGHRGGR